MSRYGGSWVLALVISACSAPQANPDSPGQAPVAPPATDNPQEPASEPEAQSDAPEATATETVSTEPPEPQHCPAGMAFIDDDYCTEVEHNCVRHWHAKANDKKVCEEFEPWSKCTGARVKKRFCIDQYAWPNQAGERPEVMNNFYQAQVKCAALGKRLCTESEWSMACEGPELLPFPYGYVRDPNKCNGDREWDHPNMNKVAQRDPNELARLWQGVRAGSQPHCVSGYGVSDLPANADEVAASETYATNYRGKFDSVTTGGPWYKGVRNQCRPKIYTHSEGFYYYYLSFRCCAEPDGQETDPRTPKQIKRDWGFERIERLAQFNREEVREKLKLKQEGRCECAASDILCKTMCGTLLGPGAKDAVLAPTTPEDRKDRTQGAQR